MISFRKNPNTLKFQMPRGQKESRMLVNSFKILVANTIFVRIGDQTVTISDPESWSWTNVSGSSRCKAIRTFNVKHL